MAERDREKVGDGLGGGEFERRSGRRIDILSVSARGWKVRGG
jgi:hypothetical protein